MLAPGSIRKQQAEDSISVTETHNTGVYHIDGYANGGEPGYVEVRLLDAHSKQQIDSQKAQRSQQYIGWSADRTVGFYWDAIIEVDRAAEGEVDRNVQVQLVFFPSSPTVLASRKIVLKTWTK